MPQRYFAPITIDELKAKINTAFSDEYGHLDKCILREKLQKDLKVDFDLENFEYNRTASRIPIGYRTLPNGLTFCGFYAGGDWEIAVFFIVYFDGKKLRGYVPTEGNPWNTTTKRAYGNDDEADFKNGKKRYPDPEYWDGIELEDFDGTHLDCYDDTLMIQDITERIIPKV